MNIELRHKGRKAFAASIFALAMGTMAPQAMADTYNIRLSNLYPENHPMCIQTNNFAKFVEEGTDGNVKVEVYCNNQLGNEREASEGVRRGSLEMVMSGGGGLGRFVPEFYTLELPFLYPETRRINDVTWALIDDINDLANKRGFEILGFGYEGPRSINSVESFDTLAEMENYKLRIPEAPLYVGMAKALGAIPTPTAFTEAYTSLQTGVADGMESGPSTTYNNKFFEVAPYYVQTEHIVNPCYLAINLDYFNALPEEYQQVFRDAGKRSTDIMLEDVLKSNDEVMAKMKDEGLTVVELAPGEAEKFRDVLKPFSEEYAKSIGDDAVNLLAKIREVLAEE
ncbi:TRAP transporter substrate-binding protein [Pseudohoeflea coraliihabitans]|uniref:TRAP transporter substrate-binding protein n=1 Tax=Pseudohoeflea coraliihabitans TaxID=2860393 RepID=A0ABS6WMN9_9HYPH|nr:TRAP transporter substrate-binding protein [Pseudohoeflea sp. DP4N28-3]MBW3097216.1 TRAP transporter substrate-binding protein [Pseudohoeflea sp. DP4N28-3]